MVYETDRKKVTIAEAMPYFHPVSTRPTHWKGRETWIGPCPICGGTDRGALQEDDKGRAVFFCRQGSSHSGTNQKGYWFADNIIWLAFGVWIGDERYDPRLSDEERSDLMRSKPLPRPEKPAEKFDIIPYEPPAPKFDELVDSPVQASIDEVNTYCRNIDPAIRYFGKYGITPATLEKFHIGYAENPPHCRIPYGYSIPNISLGPNGKLALRGMQFRRHEDACRQMLIDKPGWAATKRAELRMWRYNQFVDGKEIDYFSEPSDEDLIEHFFPKYSSVSGSKPGVWGDDLVSLPGGERIGPTLPYIFVSESAKCAMVLRQEGYPAVAYKQRADWNYWLYKVFSRVLNVYIIADRDEASNNAGAGMRTALELEQCILKGQKSRARVLLPPGHHKQVSDLVSVDGFDAMHSWISATFPGTVPFLNVE